MTSSSIQTAQVADHTRRLGDYKETLSRLFPALPKEVVNFWSIKDGDALVLALFLECYPHEVAVLEVGTLVGVSTFHFASHPKVSRVLGVDPNPLIADEVSQASKILEKEVDPEPLPELRVLDIARAALAEFADENAKIQLRTGTVGTAGDTFDSSGEVPAWELADGEPLLAFVDGAHTREAVDADLKAIFDSNPRAIAILDDCRRAWGPFVQAGIASFMERAQGKYHFELFGDLSAGMATSNLGIVYSEVDSVEVRRSLAELSHLFSERLDPLWLAGREQELIGIASAYKEEADSLRRQHEDLISELADRKTGLQNRVSQLEKRKSQVEEAKSRVEERNAQLRASNAQLERRASHLEKRNSQLEERNSQLQKQVSRVEERNAQLGAARSQLEMRNSQLEKDKLELNSQLGVYRAIRRYRVADAVAENVLRIPGARALAMRNRQEQ